jgi:DNA-binding response OmpR family regulator
MGPAAGPSTDLSFKLVSAMRLLLIEDSARLRSTLNAGLRKAGYAVDTAGDGREGLWLATENDYDVIVLDLMLPQVDGLTVLRTLRERGKSTHVLILSARDLVEDRIQGLRLGADDYLVKPFSFDELCARIEALVRRSYRAKNPVIRNGLLEINTAARRVAVAGREVKLTAREYSLLEILVLRAGEVVSRRELWERLYEFDSEAVSNVVDVLIYSLRKKLNPDDPQSLVKTRRGQGYVIDLIDGIDGIEK